MSVGINNVVFSCNANIFGRALGDNVVWHTNVIEYNPMMTHIMLYFTHPVPDKD